jgi:hypothetical protein
MGAVAFLELRAMDKPLPRASLQLSQWLFCRYHLGRHRANFGYSDTWQLVINTGTTIVTF